MPLIVDTQFRDSARKPLGPISLSQKAKRIMAVLILGYLNKMDNSVIFIKPWVMFIKQSNPKQASDWST